MMDWLFGYPVIAQGAGAQQASAEYFRRQQMDMLQAQGDGVKDATAAMHAAFNACAPTPEQRAEWERYDATRRHVDGLRVAHGPDWVFWYWLVGMCAAWVGFRLIPL